MFVLSIAVLLSDLNLAQGTLDEMVKFEFLDNQILVKDKIFAFLKAGDFDDLSLKFDEISKINGVLKIELLWAYERK